MSRKSYLWIGVVAALALVPCVGSVNAETITVTNPSFETPTLAVDGWAAPTGGWAHVASGSSAVWIVHPDSSQFTGAGSGTPLNADGTNVFEVENSDYGYIYQTTGATFTANMVYTLTVAVGESSLAGCMDNSFDIDIRYGVTGSGFGTQLGAGSGSYYAAHPAAPAALLTAGQFTDFTASYTALPGDASLTQPVQILIGAAENGSGLQTYFDNVRLTVAPVPEPSVLALVTSGLIGLLCYA